MTTLIETAPGATRALVLAGDTVFEAHLRRSDVALPWGLIATTRLVRREAGQAVVQAAGEEALLAPVPADWHQGQSRLAKVVREARSDGARDKQARLVAHEGPAQAAPWLIDLFPDHEMISPFGPDLLAEAGWDAVMEEAITGVVDFPGGRLLMAPTPGMLVIDVDGAGDPGRLAAAAAHAVAATIRRHGIGGPLVVDFPSLGGRAARAAVDALLAEHLPAPFEKTAMNGFGLVQIIRPRGRLSLLEEARRPGFAALELLRRAMRLTGAVTITGPAAVHDWLSARPALTAELARLTGGRVALQRGDIAHVQQG
ncbi:ribonuclease [Sandarakinorhabdus sp.]|uniref:ribonuclease n=1 Tax=Sandarakinorhabdus sp. TaxID=1916663 RepID=UPI003F70FE7D